MPFVLRHALEIAAPTSLVWEVITDLPRYPEWNPFVVRAKSSLQVGKPISMRVRVLPLFAQPQREIILECLPEERLCYGIPGLPLGALRSRRYHEIRPDGTDRTHYGSHFELDGWLAPLTRALLAGRLEQGFAAMTQAIQQRAEELQYERRQG